MASQASTADLQWSDWDESDEEDTTADDIIENESTDTAVLDRKVEELRTVLQLLDDEEPAFDFQAEKNDNHLLPPFQPAADVGSHHVPEQCTTPLELFQLFYSDSLLERVSDQ